MAKARKAVQDDGAQQQVIKTQHGRGYRFVAEVSMPADGSLRVVVSRSEDRGAWFGQTFPPYRQSRLLAVLGVFLVVVSAAVVWQRSFSPSLRLELLLSQQHGAGLKGPSTRAEQSRLQFLSTDSRAALDYLLRGWDSFHLLTPQTNGQARRMFQHAIEVDSSYAAAYASLGWTYVIEWVWFWSEDPNGLEQALRLAQKAITLNAACPYAHTLLADVYLLQKRHARAIAEVKRAIALDPACAQCSVSLARILTFAGRPQEAVGLVERAMRLDPAFAAYYAADSGHAYRLLGRYEVAIAELKRALLHNPNLFFARTNLALVYNELGRQEEARTELAKGLRFTPYASLQRAQQMMPYTDQAKVDQLLTVLRQAGVG